MINRLLILFFTIASIGNASDFNHEKFPSGISSENVVIAVDFEEHSARNKTSELIGSVLVVDSGGLFIRLSGQAEWRKQEDVSKKLLASYQLLVSNPSNLKPFVYKDDERRFRFDMNNYHVHFPEAIRVLYRTLIATNNNQPP